MPAKKPPQTTGQRFRAAREALGLTPTELARRLSVKREYVAAIESDRKTPTLNRLWEYAEVLGIDPSSLDPRLASSFRKT